MDRFVCNIKVSNNNETVFVDIPYGINLQDARFMVSEVAGKMSADNKFVQIGISQLTNSGVYNTANNSTSILASTVLNSTASKPTNRVVDKHSIGYKCPAGLHNQSCPFTIQLTDESGTAYTDAEVIFLVVTLTFWSPL